MFGLIKDANRKWNECTGKQFIEFQKNNNNFKSNNKKTADYSTN